MVKNTKKKEDGKVLTKKNTLKSVKNVNGKEEKEKKSSKLRDSLDSLFQQAKETKEKNKKKKEKEEKKEQLRIKREFEAINEMKTANGDPIGYDEESGMKVYREDQLNLGKGGNTPLCPFDCDCCF